MPALTDIPGIPELWTHTKGDRRIKIALIDGPVDLNRACFQGSNLTKIQPYWDRDIPIEPKYLEAYLAIENSGDREKTRSSNLIAAIPDQKIRELLFLGFHGTHISSIIFGQPNSPIRGMAPNCTGFNIPVAYDYDNFICPINLSRAINLAIDRGVHIIHIAACRRSITGIAHEILEKAVRQCQENNILIVSPTGNDKGECYCVPAVLPSILAVGAMKDNGQPFKFSNWGGRYQTQGIIAPGENIFGAQPGTDKPIAKQGTSCAAPIVTGLCALLLSLQLQQGLSPDPESVRAAILNSAIACDPETVAEPERCLRGKLNVAGAFELSMGKPLATFAPTSWRVASSEGVLPGLSPDEAIGLKRAKKIQVAASMPGEVTELSVPTPNFPKTAENPESVTRLATGVAPSARSNLVYVLGTLGYDFGTEARRDSFKQLMPAVEINGTQVPANPYDARQMVDYLDENLSEARSLIWTLNLEHTPVYAIAPVGAFGADIYQTLLQMLAGQLEAETSVSYIERVSIPGRSSDRTVKLFSGQVIPVLRPNSPRGMYGWNVNALVNMAVQTVRSETGAADEEAIEKSLGSFLNRVYYDLGNLGQTGRDRALNFAATNVFQAVTTFSEAVAAGMELDSVEVEKSPFCRLHSDCWDVKLKFFDPENARRSRKVFRFTIDVSDLNPVTLGEIRSWSVSK